MKMSTLQKKQMHFWFRETKSDILSQQNLRCKCGTGREPTAMSAVRSRHKNLWRLVECKNERAGRSQTSEETKSVSAAYTTSLKKSIYRTSILCCCRYHAPLFMKFYIKVCNVMHMKCSYCRLLKHKISCNKKSLQ